MSTTEPPAIYDELLDLFTEAAAAEKLLSFSLSPPKQARLEDLLRKSSEGALTAVEEGELDEFERLEHFGRMLKARLRQKQQP